MNCPQCLHGTTKTLDTRCPPNRLDSAAAQAIAQDWPDSAFRRRECPKCGYRYRTVEVPIEDWYLATQTPG